MTKKEKDLLEHNNKLVQEEMEHLINDCIDLEVLEARIVKRRLKIASLQNELLDKQSNIELPDRTYTQAEYDALVPEDGKMYVIKEKYKDEVY